MSKVPSSPPPMATTETNVGFSPSAGTAMSELKIGFRKNIATLSPTVRYVSEMYANENAMLPATPRRKHSAQNRPLPRSVSNVNTSSRRSSPGTAGGASSGASGSVALVFRTMALHSTTRLHVVNTVTAPDMHDLTKTTSMGGTLRSTLLATTFWNANVNVAASMTASPLGTRVLYPRRPPVTCELSSRRRGADVDAEPASPLSSPLPSSSDSESSETASPPFTPPNPSVTSARETSTSSTSPPARASDGLHAMHHQRGAE